MKTHTWGKYFSILLVFHHLSLPQMAAADTCGTIITDPTCENVCQCNNEKYSAYSIDEASLKPASNSTTNTLTSVNKNSMESGKGILVQLKAYCDAYDIEKETPKKIKTEMGLAISASVLCFMACIPLVGLAFVPGCTSLVGATGGVTHDDFKWMEGRAEEINQNYSYLESTLNDLYKESSSNTADDRKKALALATAGTIASLASVVPGAGCIFGGIMADIAEKKRRALPGIKDLAGETCEGAIKPLAMNAAGWFFDSKTGNPTDRSQAAKDALAATQKTTANKSTSNAPSDTSNNTPKTDGGSNATAIDVIKNSNTTQFDPDAIDAALKEHLNTSIAELGKKMESGSSAAQVISEMVPKLPEEIKSGLLEAEKHPEKRPKDPWGSMFPGVPSIMTGGNHGGGNSKSSDDLLSSIMNFGSAAGGAASVAGQTSELNFSGKRGVASGPEDGDIYHSQWKGTIFGIITMRIEKFKNYITHLDWIGKYNRATHGLSPLTEAPTRPGLQLNKTPPPPSPPPRKPIVPEFIQNGGS